MDDIIYLTHFTNIDNINDILKNNYLYTNIERVKNNIKYKSCCSTYCNTYEEKDFSSEFPGVYMSYVSKCDINTKIKYIGNICLVFNKKLLEQFNYHINLVDNNGFISEYITYFSVNAHQLPPKKSIEDFYKKHYGYYCGNEVVFHDKIHLSALCEIWVKTSTMFNLLRQKIPKKFHYLIHYKTLYVDIPLNIKEIYSDKVYQPFYLSLDYQRSGFNKKLYPHDNIEKSSENHYLKIAKSLNISDYVIYKYDLSNPKNLDKYLIKNKIYSKIHKNRSKQNIYALFNSSMFFSKKLNINFNYNYTLITCIFILFSLLFYTYFI